MYKYLFTVNTNDILQSYIYESDKWYEDINGSELLFEDIADYFYYEIKDRNCSFPMKIYLWDEKKQLLATAEIQIQIQPTFSATLLNNGENDDS